MSRLSVTVTLLVPLLFTTSLVVGYSAAPATAFPPDRPIVLTELLERSVRGLLRPAPLPTGSVIALHRVATAVPS